MMELNAPFTRLPMPYEAGLNFKLQGNTLLQADRIGHCKNCGSKIIPAKTPDEFYMDAGYGFNWIVSNQTSLLCDKCFQDLKMKAKPSTYQPERVRCIGKTRNGFSEIEILEVEEFAPGVGGTRW